MNKHFLITKFKKIASLVAMFALIMMATNNIVSAAEVTMVRVNGVLIYESPGGYNAGHGIAGVTFDTDTKTLGLNGASLESINANGDMTINLTGNNAVDAVTSNIAVEVRGNLNIIGSNGSSLNIMAMSADDRAIEISAGSTLTIGDVGNLANLITVGIQRGRNVNTEGNTTIVEGNTYNYSTPGGGEPGDPVGPPPGDPLQLFMNGIMIIDETARPQVNNASGEGWSIAPGFMNIYELEVEAGASLGYLSGTGDGAISINPQNGDIYISDNIDGLSINMDGNVNIMTGMGAITGDIILDGGIYTQGSVSINDRNMSIGTSEVLSSSGVAANSLEVGSGNLTINTTGTALQYYNPTPVEGEGMFVESTAGKSLIVESSDVATLNVSSMRVSGGGIIDLSYTSSLGFFVSEASHWPWTDMAGTEEENSLPITVTCEEGTDVENKYRLTTGIGNYLLESTAGTLYQLGWNIPDTDDSTVSNGTVRVVAANGFRFTSGGYTDYSLEAGSTVTIELLPDYGYQYVSGGLNGNQTMPDEGKASYTFTMPSNNLHLSAIFEKSDDKVTINSDKVVSSTIELPSGEINGNADFTVANAINPDQSAFNKAASGSTVGSYLDLSLKEVIYKGTPEDAWTTNITELDQPMTVNLNLADDLKGHTNYKILRNHNGVITELNNDYNASTGVLTFSTDKYSTYAIAYTDTATTITETPDTMTANPQTYDGIKSQVLIGIISLVGIFGLLIYRKRAKIGIR